MSLAFLPFLAGCFSNEKDQTAGHEFKAPDTFVKPPEPYFVVSETEPLKSCTEPHPVNPVHTTNPTYASPADFCRSGDNYTAVEFDFLCLLEDCRLTLEGALWCPQIPIRNCAAFRCVGNRSEREKSEFSKEATKQKNACPTHSPLTWPLSPQPECF